MAFSTVRYEKADTVGILTFDTPDQMNSLTDARFADLEAVLDSVEADGELGALIIASTGKAFCVGLDLDLLKRAFDELDYFETVVRRLNRIITRIEALPIPTIVAVNGFARAGGFEIAMGCDFMIIADEAKIGDVHTDSGVVPACVSLRLKRRIGEQKAKELLWTARWLTGPEAVAYGMALKSVPRDRLLDEAKAFAATLTDKPRPAITSLKTIFREGATLDVAEGAELELRSFMNYMRNQPYGREGFYAFVEKRQPNWRPAKG